jgi:8-oxo-dGTP diphosphatase
MMQDSGELGQQDHLRTMLICGTPRSGKTSTVVRKIDEAFRQGCTMSLICIDPHARKIDSLASGINAYEDRLLVPVASKEEEIITALEWFLGEFGRRLGEGKGNTDILLLVDEVEHITRFLDSQALKLLRMVATICGQESRTFGMFGWFISQQANGPAWMNNVMPVLVMSATNKRQPQHYVTVDLLIVHPTQRSVLLIQRRKPPYEGYWALPGGHVEVARQENLEQAARRELVEETGLDCTNWPLRLLGAFGDPSRDPRGAYISILYGVVADTPELPAVSAGDDAGAAAWWPLHRLPNLAFDHELMTAYAPQLFADEDGSAPDEAD